MAIASRISKLFRIWLPAISMMALAFAGRAGAGDFAAAVARLDLAAVQAPLPTVAAPGLEARARRYAATIGRALDFFDEQLGWRIDFRLAVLDRPRWEQVTSVPWPAPFVDSAEAYIVMPATISEYPGFDQWRFEDEALSEVLTVHEVGHALGSAHGLGSANHHLHELIADIFMAAFILDRHPSMLALLDGPPEGFGPFSHSGFADLDYLYSGVGLLDYAWYQFELARLARSMLAEKSFPELATELRAALADKEPLLPESARKLLAGVTPSIDGALARFGGASSLPEIGASPCTGAEPPAGAENVVLIFENPGSRDRSYTDRFGHKMEQQEADGIAMLTGGEAEIVPLKQMAVEAGTFWPIYPWIGQELELDDGRCLTVPASIARFSYGR